VNSATHIWGSRRFATRDNSRTNWWVALITSGEGWHNNHHAHPTSARHGLLWYEFDLSWIQIRTLKFFGLAKSVRVAKVAGARVGPDAFSEKSDVLEENTADGDHPWAQSGYRECVVRDFATPSSRNRMAVEKPAER
jgi:hypothetical protein